MSTYDMYSSPVAAGTWDVPATGAARFSWEYDDGRTRLLALYQKGKDKQWDAAKRIDWDHRGRPVATCLGLARSCCRSTARRHWEKLGQERARRGVASTWSSWQFSQFLHGEQGAMICSARIVESVPDLDSKFYAATQTMDEARHAETYARFLQDKIGLVYPINDHLQRCLADTLSDSRWDMPYLGMQVLIEGLALAAFGLLRDTTTNPLPKQILATSCRTRRVTSRSAGWRCATTTRTSPRRSATSARSSSSRPAT